MRATNPAVLRVVTAIARREMARAVRFDEAGKLTLPDGDGRDRMLYLHVPFCESLCPYCSFHRVVFEERLARDYFAALRREIGLYKQRGYSFTSAYVGGGTPTVLVDELKQTLDFARERFPLREVSVETNPNHLTDERLTVLEQAGVNRLSVGVQSFDDALLKAMNRFDRCGSGADTARRLKAALGRFDTVNADMIFNFPAQDAASLERDVDTLMETGVDQVTYYPLMVSDLTRHLVDAAIGHVDRTREEGLYRRIAERLAPAYSPSSVWCSSRISSAMAIDEYIAGNDEYAGLGSGAIGYVNGTSYANTFDIERYIADVSRGELPVWAARRFGAREQVRYDFMMKLFSGSLDVDAVRQKHGGAFRRYLWPDVLVFQLVGALRRDGRCLRLTERGRYLWVVMMREFFTAVNNLREFCRREAAAGLGSSGRRSAD